ncbi:MAG: 6-carboxytetrahydropterin synthase QueD [Candidatus Omnitrophica bacterium]|nr:6-carboxytetrahydropterin synthase QueD [Candidatus Omnitrophota bacterium]MCM8776740.1 6-carboxytetrahydropterin synthase QueD [Candidatus Omnitrophota bacterium]
MSNGIYEIKVEETFSSAHHLRNYRGKCERVHGHNWKVEVYVIGDNLDEDGLLIDFAILKDKLKDILGALDHRDLNTIHFFRKRNPTSESLSLYIYEKMTEKLKEYSVRVKRVTVWENEKQSASYSVEE